MEKPFPLPILSSDRSVHVQRAHRLRNQAILGMVRRVIRVVRAK